MCECGCGCRCRCRCRCIPRCSSSGFPWCPAVFLLCIFPTTHFGAEAFAFKSSKRGDVHIYIKYMNIYIVSSRLKSGLSHQRHQRCPRPSSSCSSCSSLVDLCPEFAFIYHYSWKHCRFVAVLFLGFSFFFVFCVFFINAQYAQQPWKNNTFNTSYFLCVCRCQMWCLSQQCFYHLHFKQHQSTGCTKQLFAGHSPLHLCICI